MVMLSIDLMSHPISNGAFVYEEKKGNDCNMIYIFYEAQDYTLNPRVEEHKMFNPTLLFNELEFQICANIVQGIPYLN